MKRAPVHAIAIPYTVASDGHRHCEQASLTMARTTKISSIQSSADLCSRKYRRLSAMGLTNSQGSKPPLSPYAQAHHHEGGRREEEDNGRAQVVEPAPMERRRQARARVELPRPKLEMFHDAGHDAGGILLFAFVSGKVPLVRSDVPTYTGTQAHSPPRPDATLPSRVSTRPGVTSQPPHVEQEGLQGGNAMGECNGPDVSSCRNISRTPACSSYDERSDLAPECRNKQAQTRIVGIRP
jgi:hypothetical protein